MKRVALISLLLGACAGPLPPYELPPAGRAEMALTALDPATRYRAVLSQTTPTMFPTAARAQLAPGGTLRAAINFGNAVLARRDTVTREPTGVSVDIARELARQLMVPVKLVTYEAAGKVVEGITRREWDIAFYAIDPVRAADTAFSAPYVLIEGAYAVRRESPITSNDQVDRAGQRIVVGRGSVYDLYLTRAIGQATLVRAPTSPQVVDVMMAGQHQVAAGLRPQLEADARRVPGLRVLDGRFMVIEQALAVPRDHGDAVGALTTFIEGLKASGFIAESLRRHAIDGAKVAPAAP